MHFLPDGHPSISSWHFVNQKVLVVVSSPTVAAGGGGSADVEVDWPNAGGGALCFPFNKLIRASASSSFKSGFSSF